MLLRSAGVWLLLLLSLLLLNFFVLVGMQARDVVPGASHALHADGGASSGQDDAVLSTRVSASVRSLLSVFPGWDGKCVMETYHRPRMVINDMILPPYNPSPWTGPDVETERPLSVPVDYPPSHALRALYGYMSRRCGSGSGTTLEDSCSSQRAAHEPILSVVTVLEGAEQLVMRDGRREPELAHSLMTRQSLQNDVEWLIVGAWSEPVNEVLRDLEATSWRISLVRLDVKPANTAAALNQALRRTRGRYVVALPADAQLEATFLEEAVWFLESHPPFALVAPFTVALPADRDVVASSVDNTQSYVWHSSMAECVSDARLPPVQQRWSAAVYRRELLVDPAIDGYDETLSGPLAYFHDLDLIVRLALNDHVGSTIREHLFWPRVAARTDWDELYSAMGELLKKHELSTSNINVPVVRYHPSEPVRVDSTAPFENALNPLGRPRFVLIVSFIATGGASTFELRMLEMLASHGWDLTVVAITDDVASLRSYLRFTPDAFVLPRFLAHHEHPPFLAYLLRSRQANVAMVTNSEHGYMYLPYMAAHAPDVAFVDYSHSEEPEWKLGGYTRYSIQSEPYLARSLFASKQLFRWAVARGHNVAKCKEVHIGLDPADYIRDEQKGAALRQRHNLSPQTRVVFFIARIEEGKLPLVFAEVMGRLTANKLDYHCFVIGDGSMLPAVREALILNGAIHDVTLVGMLPSREVKDWLHMGDIIFLPTKREGISLALMEAMALEIVPVSVEVGGQAELILPNTGVLIPLSEDHAKMTRQFTDALQFLILDEEILNRRRKNAKQMVHAPTSGFNIHGMDANLRKEFCIAVANVPVYDGREFLNSVEELQRQYVESMRMQVELKELQEQWKLESSHSLGESLRMLDVRWAGGLHLFGTEYASTAKSGTWLPILLVFYLPYAPSDRPYQIFLHVRRASDQVNVAQGDHPLNMHSMVQPLHKWAPGTVIFDSVRVFLYDVPVGTYDVIMGFFDIETMNRLPLHEGYDAKDWEVIIGQLDVVEQSRVL